MREYNYRLAGDQVRIIRYDSRDDDLSALTDLVSSSPVVGFDTESSGTDPYEPGFFTRLAQFGNHRESHVLAYDIHADSIARCIRQAGSLAIHNASHDLDILSLCYGIPLVESHPKTIDTLTLSRCVDPMGYSAPKGEGKIVPLHNLKDRTRQLIDGSFDADKALKDEFRRLKLKVSDGYAHIDIDNPVYNLYAGLDPVLAVRLLRELSRDATPTSLSLFEYERRVSLVLAQMHQRGLLVDHEYTKHESAAFLQIAHDSHQMARDLGFPADGIAKKVDKEAVAEWYTSHGYVVPKASKGGISLAKPAIYQMLGDADDEVAEATRQFFEAKELTKFDADYLQKFLRSERLHPRIDGMGAQTARMSISGPPLQQIPSHGTTRGCLIADEGRVLVGCDKAQIEVRVGAALAGDANMIRLIKAGLDVPGVIAKSMFGENYSEDQRAIAKRAVYGRLYGAGAATVARQTGTTEGIAKQALHQIDRMFPDLRRLAKRLGQQQHVDTFVGRRVPVDALRSWGAINYAVQSSARDVFVFDMLRLVDAGLGEYLWIPVHDELILNVPEDMADDVSHALETIMTGEFRGVPCTAKAKIMGKRWSK